MSDVQGRGTIPRWLLYDESFSIFAKVVYVVLDSHADEYGHSFPSHAKIAAEGSMSVSSAKRGIEELKKARILTFKNRTRENRSKTSNLYRLSATRPS